MILKHLFLSFLVAEPRRWNPLGAGETSMSGEAVLTCRACWNWPFDMGKVRGITGFSDCELHWGHPQDYRCAIYSFKTLALEHSFWDQQRKRLCIRGSVFKSLTPISDGKRLKMFFQRHSRTFLRVLTSWNVNPLFITTPLWLCYTWFLEVIMNSTPLAFSFSDWNDQ